MLSVFKLVSCKPEASRELALRSSKFSKLVSSEVGGSKPFFGRIYFEPRAPQMPLVKGETFGEDSGPRSSAIFSKF